MKAIEGLTEREVEGELIVLHSDSGNIHQFNHVAAFIWKNLKQGMSLEEIEDSVADHFEINCETAKKDVDEFLAQLQALKLVEMT